MDALRAAKRGQKRGVKPGRGYARVAAAAAALLVLREGWPVRCAAEEMRVQRTLELQLQRYGSHGVLAEAVCALDLIFTRREEDFDVELRSLAVVGRRKRGRPRKSPAL